MARSPYPNAEAELMALFLDSTIVAQSNTYSEMERALTVFREQYATFDSAWWFKPEDYYHDDRDWINVAQIQFRYPHYVGKLKIEFHDSIAQVVSDADYHDWDSLNAYYHLDSLQVYYGTFGIPAILFFHPRLDSKRLAVLYQALPGIWDVTTSTFRSDGSNLLPWRDTDGRICFLADLGWGDCPSSCIQHRYYYFKQRHVGFERNIFYLVGSFQTGDPMPSWWDEISPAKQRWLNY
jgi:hypothetical protein